MGYNINVLKNDITEMHVDAIVNAANKSLMGGGGVDGAIHRKGGKTILEECIKIVEKYGECATGNAVYTSAGNLDAKYVIHTVGPIWRGGNNNENELLSNCYTNSLCIANKLNVDTIAFPNISTGVYRFPKELAAKIAIQTVKDFMEVNNSTIKEIYFVCFDDENYNLYTELLKTK